MHVSGSKPVTVRFPFSCKENYAQLKTGTVQTFTKFTAVCRYTPPSTTLTASLSDFNVCQLPSLLGQRCSALLPNLMQPTLDPLADHGCRVRGVAFQKLMVLQKKKTAGWNVSMTDLTHTHMRTHTYTHTQTHIHTHSCTHMHTHTHKHIRTHACTHTQTHMHTHTHTHTSLSISKQKHNCANIPSKCYIILHRIYHRCSTH